MKLIQQIIDLFLDFSKTNVFQTLLGFLLGLVSALCLERNRKPKLSLSVLPARDHSNPTRFRTVAVVLKNAKPNKVVSWFTHREGAIGVSAKVRFLCEDGRGYFSQSMPGRWANSPQPPEVALANGKLSPYALSRLDYCEVLPGVDEQIDVAIRFESEDECYGFTNMSYFQRPWGKHNEFKMSQGRYLVEVRVSHTGGEIVGRFLLRNDGPNSEFKLETL